MTLKKAIHWANKQSNKYLTYHVLTWNDKYIVCTESQVRRYKKNYKSVYNSRDKEIIWDNVHGAHKFDATSEKVKLEVLEKVGNIAPTYICSKEFRSGPPEGTILKPKYSSKFNYYYSWETSHNTSTTMDKTGLDRLFVYFKEYDKDIEEFDLGDKIPKVEKSRLGRLLSKAK